MPLRPRRFPEMDEPPEDGKLDEERVVGILIESKSLPGEGLWTEIMNIYD